MKLALNDRTQGKMEKEIDGTIDNFDATRK